MSTIGEQMQETPETAHKRMMQDAATERRAEIRTWAKWGCCIAVAALAVTLFTAAVMVAAFLFGYGFGLPDRTVGIACMAVGLVIAIAALVVLRIWANSPTAEDE